MATVTEAATSTTTTTTVTQTDDQLAKILDTDPATTEGISVEKSSASATDSKEGGPGETKADTTDPVTVTEDNSNSNNNEDGDSVTNTQRKIRRAERFGMPVQLSEAEKRNSRAERFGVATGSQGLDATKKSEDLKRKARAERFGITQSTPSEEDEKKKARLSRFGLAKRASVDPLEEEKKKARALRFSGTQANGNGNIEQKTMIAGKAGGEA